MQCPNCGKEMKDRSRCVELTFFTGDDPDYCPTQWVEEHYCKECKIKYKDNNWTIPNTYSLATERQIKCVNFINKQLGYYFEPVLKNQTWRFIKKYLPKAQEAYDDSFDEWCEENADWLSEEF